MKVALARLRAVLMLAFMGGVIAVAGCDVCGVAANSGSRPLMRFNPKLNTPYIYTVAIKWDPDRSQMTTTASAMYTQSSPGNFLEVTTVTDEKASGALASTGHSLKGSKTTREITDRAETTHEQDVDAHGVPTPGRGIGFGAQGAVFPDGPIFDGESWKSVSELGIIADYWITNIEGQTVTIRTAEKTISPPLEFDATYNFSLADGTLVNSVRKIHTSMPGKADFVSTITTTRQ